MSHKQEELWVVDDDDGWCENYDILYEALTGMKVYDTLYEAVTGMKEAGMKNPGWP